MGIFVKMDFESGCRNSFLQHRSIPVSPWTKTWFWKLGNDNTPPWGWRGRCAVSAEMIKDIKFINILSWDATIITMYLCTNQLDEEPLKKTNHGWIIYFLFFENIYYLRYEIKQRCYLEFIYFFLQVFDLSHALGCPDVRILTLVC